MRQDWPLRLSFFFRPRFSVRVSVLTGQVKAEAERLKAEITKISDMLAAIEAEGRAKALEERTTAVRASFEAVLAEVTESRLWTPFGTRHRRSIAMSMYPCKCLTAPNLVLVAYNV